MIGGVVGVGLIGADHIDIARLNGVAGRSDAVRAPPADQIDPLEELVAVRRNGAVAGLGDVERELRGEKIRAQQMMGHALASCLWSSAIVA